MTTKEKKLKRKQKLASDIQWFKRVTGASWAQMEKFSGVYYAALRDYFNVRREINEEHFAKLQDMFSRKDEFIASITPVEKFCVDCGVSVGFGHNIQRCPECRKRREKENGLRYRERVKALQVPEAKKKKLSKEEKKIFMGMSDNMRKISAVEVEARKHGSDYGKFVAVCGGKI